MSEAETWALGDYGCLAERLLPVYETLVAALAPKTGERWLDVATGTGGIALRAARAGALVTGLDVAPAMVEAARAEAMREGLELELVDADGRALPFADESFDVVSSCLGFSFEPEESSAHEDLVRVCRREGRIGIVVWCPNPDQDEALRPVTGSGRIAYEHSTPQRAHDLLDERVEIETAICTWYLEENSPQALYELIASVNPPIVSYLRRLDREQREQFRDALVGYWQRYATANGVRVPSDYLLVTGRRR